MEHTAESHAGKTRRGMNRQVLFLPCTLLKLHVHTDTHIVVAITSNNIYMKTVRRKEKCEFEKKILPANWH